MKPCDYRTSDGNSSVLYISALQQFGEEVAADVFAASQSPNLPEDLPKMFNGEPTLLSMLAILKPSVEQSVKRLVKMYNPYNKGNNQSIVRADSMAKVLKEVTTINRVAGYLAVTVEPFEGNLKLVRHKPNVEPIEDKQFMLAASEDNAADFMTTGFNENNIPVFLTSESGYHSAGFGGAAIGRSQINTTSIRAEYRSLLDKGDSAVIEGPYARVGVIGLQRGTEGASYALPVAPDNSETASDDKLQLDTVVLRNVRNMYESARMNPTITYHLQFSDRNSLRFTGHEFEDLVRILALAGSIPPNVKLSPSVIKAIELRPALIGSLMPLQSTEYDTKELNKSLEAMSVPAMKVTYDQEEGFMYEESGFVSSSVQTQYIDTMMYYLDQAMVQSETKAVNEKKTIATFVHQLNYVRMKLDAKLEEAQALALLSRTSATVTELREQIVELRGKVDKAREANENYGTFLDQIDNLEKLIDDRANYKGTYAEYFNKIQHLYNILAEDNFPQLSGFLADRLNTTGITINRNAVVERMRDDENLTYTAWLKLMDKGEDPEMEQEERTSYSYDMPYSSNYKDSASVRLKRMFATIPVGEFAPQNLEDDSVPLFTHKEPNPEKFSKPLELLKKEFKYLGVTDSTSSKNLVGKTFDHNGKWYRIRSTKFNPKTASIEFISAPAKRRRVRQEAKNVLGEPFLKDTKQLWIEVANILADQPIKTYDHYISLLEKRASTNPTIGSLVDRLKKSPQHVQQEFVMIFSLHRRAFFNVIYNDGSFIVADADANSTRKNLLNYWKVGQITSPGLEKKDGIYKPNYQAIKPLVDKYRELLIKFNSTRLVTIGSNDDPLNQPTINGKFQAKTELVDFVESFFTTLGITTKIGLDEYAGLSRDDIKLLLSSDTLERLTARSFMKNSNPGQTLQNDSKINRGLISHLMAPYVEFVNDYEANKEAGRLKEFTSSLNKESYNPLNGDTETVRTLQNFGIEAMNVKYSDNFKNSNGDTVYTFGNNSFESETFAKMIQDDTYFDELNKGNFTANSWIAKKMQSNTFQRESMRIGVADGLKDQTVGSSDAKQKNKMGVREQYAFTVNMTLRGYIKDTTTPKPSGFIDLTKSDKSLTHLIEGITKDVISIDENFSNTRLDDLIGSSFSDMVDKLPPSGSLLNNTDQNETLLDRFYSEYNRVKLWNDTFASQATLDRKTGKWVGKHNYSSEQEAQGAGLFYVSPIFNFDAIEELYLELYNTQPTTLTAITNKNTILAGLQQLWPALLIDGEITLEDRYDIGVAQNEAFDKAVLAVMSYNMLRQAKYITEQWEKNKFWDKDNRLVSTDYIRTLQTSVKSNDISILNRTGILSETTESDGEFETKFRLMKHEKGIVYDRERTQRAYNRGSKLTLDDVSMIQRAYAALDYYFNSSAFNHSMMQTVSGDPAMAYNVKKFNYKMPQAELVKKVLTVYQKRLAKDAAPGSKRLSEKPKYVVAYGEDIKIANDYIKDINPDMMKSNATDAQELITTSEQLYQAYSEGTITKKEYEDFISIVEKAKLAYLNGMNPNLEYDIPLSYISGTGKSMSMAPRKPLQVNRAYNEATKSFAITYIKSSSYPLHPKYTKGKEIDKLRIAMELQGIDRFAFESGVKIGLSDPNVIHNSDGSIKDLLKRKEDGSFELPLRTTTLNREGFFQQQANPGHTHDDDVSFFTQPDSFFTSNLSSEKIYKVGEEMISGEELLTRKHAVVSGLYELNRDEIVNRLGFKNGSLSDLSVIHKKLVEDLTSKGASTAVIQMLDLKEDKTGTRIPMLLNSAANRYESLIMNYVQQVIKIKMTGRAFVQGSPVGSNMIEANTGTSDTIYVPGYDPTHQLRMARFAEDGVTVLPAEIIVPLNWILADGDTVSVEQLFPDGVFDETKLPEEFLEMIGIRIPNQDYNSMLPFKIVGFLPSTYENLAIVPSGITTQMGSDFDVDKLNTYRRPYKVLGNETDGYKIVTKIDTEESKLINEYFDLMRSVLLNASTLPKMLASRDAADVIDIAKVYDAKFGKTTEVEFINPTFQTNEYVVQKEAKNLVGIGAAALKSNNTIINIGKLTKDKFEVYPAMTILGLGEEQSLALNSLSDTAEYGNRTAHNDLSNMLGEFVDYANNRTIDNMNITTMTYPLMQTLIRLSDGKGNKLSLRTVIALFNQPVVRQLVEEVAINNDLFSEGMTSRNPLGDAISDRLTEELKKDRSLRGGKEKKLAAALERYNKQTKSMSYKELEAVLTDPTKEDTINVLITMSKLSSITEDVSILQSVGSIEVKGMGKNTAEANNILERIDKVSEGLPYVTNSSLLLDPSHQTGKAISLMSDMYRAIDKSIIGRKDFVDYAKEAYKLYNSDKELSTKELEQLMSSYSSYVWSSLLDNLGLEQRVRLMLDEGGLGKRIAEAKTSPLALRNKLINQLQLAPLVNGDNDYLSGIKVVYPSNTVEDGAENELTKAWMELLISTDETERKLGADLVLYSIATGANNTYDSFIRYLPTELLYQNGLDKALTIGMEDYDMVTFMEQYFQHNPNGLRKLKKGMPEMVGSELVSLMKELDQSEWGSEEREEARNKIKSYKNNFKPLAVLTVDNFSSNGKSPVDGLKNNISTEVALLPPMVSYKHLNRMYVYKLVPNTRTYVMVDTLGNGKFNEYVYGGTNAETILPKNKSMVDFAAAVNKEAERIAKKQNKLVEEMNIGRSLDSKANLLLPDRMLGYKIEKPIESLDAAVTLDLLADSTLPNRGVSRFVRAMYDKVGNLPTLQVADFTNLDNLSEEEKELGLGYYNPNDNSIMLSSRLTNRPTEFQANIYNHEMLHGLTYEALRAYERMDEDKRPESYKFLLEQYQLVKDMVRRSDYGFDSRSSDDRYVVSTIDEFVTALYTNASFMKKLNSIEAEKRFNRNETILSKIVNAITTLLQDFANVLGTNINVGNMLYHNLMAVNEIIMSREQILDTKFLFNEDMPFAMETDSNEYLLDTTKTLLSIMRKKLSADNTALYELGSKYKIRATTVFETSNQIVAQHISEGFKEVQEVEESNSTKKTLLLDSKYKDLLLNTLYSKLSTLQRFSTASTSINEALLATRIIDNWLDVHDMVFKNDLDTKSDFLDAISRLQNLKLAIINKVIKRELRTAGRSKKIEASDKSWEELKDDSFFKGILPSTMVENPAAQIVIKMMKDSLDERDRTIAKFVKGDLSTLQDKIKTAAERRGKTTEEIQSMLTVTVKATSMATNLGPHLADWRLAGNLDDYANEWTRDLLSRIAQTKMNNSLYSEEKFQKVKELEDELNTYVHTVDYNRYFHRNGKWKDSTSVDELAIFLYGDDDSSSIAMAKKHLSTIKKNGEKFYDAKNKAFADIELQEKFDREATLEALLKGRDTRKGVELKEWNLEYNGKLERIKEVAIGQKQLWLERFDPSHVAANIKARKAELAVVKDKLRAESTSKGKERLKKEMFDIYNSITRGNKADRYTTFLPNSEFIDQLYSFSEDGDKYNKIQKDPELKAIYEFTQKIVADSMKLLPDMYIERNRFGTNFLPKVTAKSMNVLESMAVTLGSVPDYMKEWADEFFSENLTIGTSESMNTTERRSLSFGYLSPKKDGTLDSTNLLRSLELFQGMAVHYDEMSKVEPYVQGAIQLLKEISVNKMVGGKNVVSDRQLVKDKGQQLVTLEILQAMADERMYLRRNPETFANPTLTRIFRKDERGNPVHWYNVKEQKRLKKVYDNLVKQRKLSYERTQDLSIPYDERVEVEETIIDVESKMRDLESREMTLAKFVNANITMSRARQLGYAPFSAMGNVTAGLASAISYGAGNEHYTNAGFFKSFWFVVKSMINPRTIIGGSRSVNQEFLRNAMTDFGFMDTIKNHKLAQATKTNLETLNEKSAKLTYKFWKWPVNPFILMSETDFLMRASLMVATLSHQKLASGESVWENYVANNGKLDSSVDFYEIKDRIESVATTVMGAETNSNSMVIGNKYWLVRMLGQYKLQWLPSAINARFGSTKFDPYLRKERTGWINDAAKTIWDVNQHNGFLPTAMFLLNNAITMVSGYEPKSKTLDGKPITPEQIANIRRTLADVMSILFIYGIYLGIKHLADDDDDEKSALTLFALNMVNRTLNDMSLYYNPFDLLDSVAGNGSLPSIKNLKDIYKAFTYVGKVIDPEREETWGDYGVYLLKQGLPIPYTAGTMKLIKNSTEEVDYLNFNR